MSQSTSAERSTWNLGDLVWPSSIKLPVEPTTRQALALSMDWKRESLFGGAAGGGKSVFLLMAALQFVDWNEYRALILRRTFPQLAIASGLLELAADWLGGQAEGINTVNGLPTKWLFKSGAALDFGHCQYLKDRQQYQGGAYHFVGWDELTQFLEGQYLYVAFSRQRRNVTSAIPIRVRATSNPGGEGHEWVRARFLGGADEIGPGTMRQFASTDRAFIPSLIRDNPYLDADDYEASLEELHPYERAQLMSGDWDVRPPGSLFEREWFRVLEDVSYTARKSVRYWDLAATEQKAGNDPDWSVGTLMHKVEGASVDFVIEDVQRFRMKPGPLEARIRSIAEADGHKVTQIIEQEPGSSGKIATTALGRVLEGYPVRFDRPTGNKSQRAGPFASAASQGRVGVLRREWLAEWFRELEMFPGSSHDDQVDSATGAYARLAVKGGVSWDDLYSVSPSDSPSH